jgi:hypothetical protein
MLAHVEKIGATVTGILQKATDENRPTGETADRLAEEIFENGRAHDDVLRDIISDQDREDLESADHIQTARLVQ